MYIGKKVSTPVIAQQVEQNTVDTASTLYICNCEFVGLYTGAIACQLYNPPPSASMCI